MGFLISNLSTDSWMFHFIGSVLFSFEQQNIRSAKFECYLFWVREQNLRLLRVSLFMYLVLSLIISWRQACKILSRRTRTVASSWYHLICYLLMYLLYDCHNAPRITKSFETDSDCCYIYFVVVHDNISSLNVLTLQCLNNIKNRKILSRRTRTACYYFAITFHWHLLTSTCTFFLSRRELL